MEFVPANFQHSSDSIFVFVEPEQREGAEHRHSEAVVYVGIMLLFWNHTGFARMHVGMRKVECIKQATFKGHPLIVACMP